MEQPDIAAVRSLLDGAGLPVTGLRPVSGGRVSWTYFVDDQWVEVTPMLRAVHGVSSDRAAQLLGCEPTPEAWRSRYTRFRVALEQALYPRLDGDLRESMSVEYDRFLSGVVDFTPVFIHSDLGAEHILVDPRTTRPAGIIDFGWASVGDPALDFVGLLSVLGPDAVGQIIRAYGGGVCWQQLLFYWWLNPSYELVYAGEWLDEPTVRRDADTIRQRLARMVDLRQ